MMFLIRSIKPYLLIVFLLTLAINGISQGSLQSETRISLNYLHPEEYEIGGITFSGNAICDLKSLNFAVGDKIKVPGEQISKTIERLSKMGLYEDNIQITATKIQGKIIFLDIFLEEVPRLVGFVYKGVRKSEIDDFNNKVNLSQGRVVNENLKQVVKNIITNYYVDKGYYFANINIEEERDSLNKNLVTLTINVNKGRKTRINEIAFIGAEEVEISKLSSAMSNTKAKFIFRPFNKVDTAIVDFIKHREKYKNKDLAHLLLDYYRPRVRIRFKASKFKEDGYEEDKIDVIRKYNELGYRDAYIAKDTVYLNDNKELNIEIHVNEGKKYYFRNITWVGNTKYKTDVLNQVLNIRKGDVYNTVLLERNLSMNPEGLDVSTLYLDDGYLFFNAMPIEKSIEKDSVDIEIRVVERAQATINRVTVTGNTRTGDEVILRELNTMPGQKFSRSDVIRSQRQLLQMGYFNQEKLNVIPNANEVDGTVDLEYVVEEASSDQLELSIGWGSNQFIASIGVSFNNFSFKKIFKKDAWAPIPSGDGQKLSFRVYPNIYYRQFGFSFTEPWLGGKKPNSFICSFSHTNYSNGISESNINHQRIKITNATIGLSNRLKLPDDYFTMSNFISYQYYDVRNWPYFIFTSGYSHGLSYNFVLNRNSLDAVIYPKNGSDILLSLQITPPYSLFSNQDYASMEPKDRYKWLEYHKWKFNVSHYLNIVDNLVLSVRTKFGFLGHYNSVLGSTPFERFYLGGSGLSSISISDGREIIGMRGYVDEALTPTQSGTAIGGTIYQKFTFELRYPISLNPSATIFLLTFLEAGNCWLNRETYKPFEMHRSAGVGVRINLPMFGMLGLDWGYGFDPIPGNKTAAGSQFHFSINQSID
ncbi:MAG: BamA/TamA family outer membrane protein [Bacteroidales bacterium]|nr:BamA/TamA family outer membrane protein [Bacteroidales bacterium]